MTDNLELFGGEAAGSRPGARSGYQPLADKLRPAIWDAFEGLASIDQNLVQQLQRGAGNPPSLILWGPPGCGKTTLAKLIGSSYQCHFVEFSAVLGGVKQVREIVQLARKTPQRTILFVDEIHRFNKAQQDAFLPHIEDGTIIMIGATTENPSFYLTGPLLSRAKVIQLAALNDEALQRILADAARQLELAFTSEAARILCDYSGGDARRLLNVLESYREATAEAVPTDVPVAEEAVKEFLRSGKYRFYDRGGEEHYNTISAFIKSLRGSDPDAALFWGFWIMESGEDPRFLIRRMMIFASEDIGNADPRAMQVAAATSTAFEKLGLPEGRIPIAQCITYLACAPKSNRSYAAMHNVLDAMKSLRKVEVPLHLRNAPTKLMKELGYSAGYQYPHDAEEGYTADVQYLPDELHGQQFYHPAERGYEKMMKERLTHWRQLAGKKSAAED